LTQEQPVSCRACGAGVSEDALFCSRCGARLDEAGTPERRVVTALFCDLVGSTELAEGTDPEEVDRLLRRYYGLAREAIERHGGTVEKFIGDAVAVLFGFPLAHEDDPERAVRAALDIVERVRSDEIGVQVRAAVETGEAFVHDLARGHGFAAGDVMNTAARLQSAEPMSVIVGPRARASAARGFVFAEVPPLRLKGKHAPVRASLVVRARAASAAAARSIRLPGARAGGAAVGRDGAAAGDRRSAAPHGGVPRHPEDDPALPAAVRGRFRGQWPGHSRSGRLCRPVAGAGDRARTVTADQPRHRTPALPAPALAGWQAVNARAAWMTRAGLPSRTRRRESDVCARSAAEEGSAARRRGQILRRSEVRRRR
jgi:class 3 adenylate cyclase